MRVLTVQRHDAAGGEAMGCEEFGSRMQAFLGGALDHWDLERFVDHAIECAPCEARLLTMADEPGARAARAPDAGAGVTPRGDR